MGDMPECPLPTDAHLAILSVLWRIGPATVRDVHQALPDEDRRGYTTTLKLMQIMAERGLVRRDESQRSHVYTAQADEAEMQSALLDDLADKAFSGSAAKLVMRALARRPASREELDSIRRMLDEIDGEGEA
ncbi:MAG: BlaI/MecI/CopY family transcriptional regulator [bacterium]|nr:BlaI/MecI/CopY family transcriptional regulator [bacterium]